MTRAEWALLYARAQSGEEDAAIRIDVELKAIIASVESGAVERVVEWCQVLELHCAHDPAFAHRWREHVLGDTKAILVRALETIFNPADLPDDRLATLNQLRAWGIDPETLAQQLPTMSNEDAMQLVQAAVQPGPRS